MSPRPVSVVVPDPCVERGRFRVLQRSDQKFIVYDPSRPLGRRTVAVAGSLKEAVERADELSRAGEVSHDIALFLGANNTNHSRKDPK